MTCNNKFQEIDKKLKDRSFTLGVIGLGYVGLPLSLTFLRKGLGSGLGSGLTSGRFAAKL